MCYSIPGKVIDINNGAITLEYFDEKRKARNDFYELALGDYVYAQGGFVIQQIPTEEAQEILKTWKDFFYKLQEVDLALTQEPKSLYQLANNSRRKYLGNSCCVHGIIEFSNYCHNDCLYCGLRASNMSLSRYRMAAEEIIQTAEQAAGEFGFKALVLQSGEDLFFDEGKLLEIVRQIMEKAPALLILSFGERSLEIYQKLFEAGARGVLLRFETSNSGLYEKMRPRHQLEERLKLLKDLKTMGYLIMTGFLIGLPGQSEDDLLNDIHLAASLEPEMFSFGPFISHPETPLKNAPRPSLDQALTAIARTRLLYPNARILATTALETLDKEKALRAGLMAGANSLMINLTPKKYRSLYEIYPKKANPEDNTQETIKKVLTLLQELGRAPTDLGLN